MQCYWSAEASSNYAVKE